MFSFGVLRENNHYFGRAKEDAHFLGHVWSLAHCQTQLHLGLA